MKCTRLTSLFTVCASLTVLFTSYESEVFISRPTKLNQLFTIIQLCWIQCGHLIIDSVWSSMKLIVCFWLCSLVACADWMWSHVKDSVATLNIYESVYSLLTNNMATLIHVQEFPWTTWKWSRSSSVIVVNVSQQLWKYTRFRRPVYIAEIWRVWRLERNHTRGFLHIYSRWKF